MTKRAPKNIAASVHQRLLNIAKESRRPFNEVFQYYAMERFLYRLSMSEHSQDFVLKGALLFRIWDIPDTRATRDIDFLAFTDNTPERLSMIISDMCDVECPEDGLRFDDDSITAQAIIKDADYAGVRISFRGYLGNAPVSMQVDVGFNDAVHPGASHTQYPVLLDMPAPSLRAYPRETVVAEKAQAMVHLASLNSRMKDFYDIWRLSRQFGFDGQVLGEAIRKTFDRRKTTIVDFDELAAELRDAAEMEQQWSAFLD